MCVWPLVKWAACLKLQHLTERLCCCASSLLRYTKMKTATNIYIFNLALADSLFLATLPFQVWLTAATHITHVFKCRPGFFILFPELLFCLILKWKAMSVLFHIIVSITWSCLLLSVSLKEKSLSWISRRGSSWTMTLNTFDITPRQHTTQSSLQLSLMQDFRMTLG